jgi:iron-sulfur cluster assembly protein
MNKAMTLTDAAAEQVKKVMAADDGKDGDILGVKISLKDSGCVGMSYVMDYAREINPIDEIIKDKGVKIIIDSKALIFLLGTVMDYKSDLMSAGFVFNNPNQTSACGCGESVELKEAIV